MNKKYNNAVFKKLVDDTGLSIQAIADEVGIVRSTLSAIYNNRRRVGMCHVNKLCTYFNCTPNYLLGYEEVKEPCKAVSVPQESQRVIELERRIYELEQTVIRQAIEITKIKNKEKKIKWKI